MAYSGALTYGEIKGFWLAAGGPGGDDASIAAAITMLESSREPGIIQQGQPYSTTGWGLWQITPGNSVPTQYNFGEDYQLLDPWNNAEAAVYKYNTQGFGAWTTYNGIKSTQAYTDAVAATPVYMTDPGQFIPIGSAPSGTHNFSNPESTYGPTMPNSTVSSTAGWFRQADGSFHLLDSDGESIDAFVGGPTGAGIYPIAGNWTGNGTISTGWYRQADGSFHLLDKDGNSIQSFIGGPAGDTSVYPLAGNWTGAANSQTTTGWYRQTDGSFHLLNSSGQSIQAFVGGPVGDTSVYPLAGNWTGASNSQTTTGWYRQTDGSFHQLNSSGQSIQAFAGGPAGDTSVYPLAGNWDGAVSGQTKTGWYRQTDGSFHLLNSSGQSIKSFVGGPVGDTSVYPLAPSVSGWTV